MLGVNFDFLTFFITDWNITLYFIDIPPLKILQIRSFLEKHKIQHEISLTVQWLWKNTPNDTSCCKYSQHHLSHRWKCSFEELVSYHPWEQSAWCYTHIYRIWFYFYVWKCSFEKNKLPKLNVALLSKQKGVKVDRGKTVNKKWNRYRSSLKL